MKQFVSIGAASDELQLSRQTVGRIFKEMDAFTGPRSRYGEKAFRGEGKTVQVRYAALDDYMRNRAMLQDPDARKYAPAFDIREAERELGITGEPVQQPSVDVKAVAAEVAKIIAERIGGAAV